MFVKVITRQKTLLDIRVLLVQDKMNLIFTFQGLISRT